MTLSRESSLADVAFAVGAALARRGINAVLTGGACVSLHTGGAYVSHDLDFVLEAPASLAALDEALGALGFRRRGQEYRHPALALFVEFPAGPLAVGGDDRILPTELTRRGQRLRTLSPSDSCRDRLAAFFHWDDRQSLALAVAIARRHRLNWRRIAAWSASEGHSEKYQTFRQELARVRRAGDRPPRP